jgi:hypothetical protein
MPMTIKTIDVQGGPDGILSDSSTGSGVRVQPWRAERDGDRCEGRIGGGYVGLGGAPEQAVSGGKGHLYVDLEDKGSIAARAVPTVRSQEWIQPYCRSSFT